MSITIFAKDIQHLTDARYFAAWGVEWMCYDPQSLSRTEILAIIEWIEGPKHIIDVSKLDHESAMSLIELDGIDGYLTKSIEQYSAISARIETPRRAFVLDPQGAIGVFTAIRHVTTIENIEPNVIYDIKGDHTSTIQFLKSHQPSAIVLSGGQEEEVGVKSFDELDEIFEWIEDSDI